ncbi:hypothetical protein CK203_080644 [Vitis vinifera]|uniref:Uncharacterized protein n=1 Tax=Vitis vinifera TaxID=29760 RepID=A0A438EZM4_VITVI|nr:hypothetical protein CK203_080644 [Vitis vinifera]
MVPPPIKKACSERAQEEPAREVPPIAVPPSDVAGPSNTPTAKKEAGRKKVGGKEAGPATRKASSDVVPIDEVLDKKNTSTLASPPSWDEMMEMLKHVPCFTDSESPSTKNLKDWTMPETIEVLVANISKMMRQRTQLFKRLEVAEAMQAFISHRLGGREELCAKLERVKVDLVAAQKAVVDRTETLKLVEGGKGMIYSEAERLKEKGEAMKAKYKGAEQENSQLKKEMRNSEPVSRLRRSMWKSYKRALPPKRKSWRYEVRPYDCNEQPPFASRRPSGWMHFPSLHMPNLGSFRVPGLHPSNPRNECFLLVVRASSDRPTRRRAAPPPTFIWLALAFSLMLIVRFCSFPLPAHCFEVATGRGPTMFISYCVNGQGLVIGFNVSDGICEMDCPPEWLQRTPSCNSASMYWASEWSKHLRQSTRSEVLLYDARPFLALFDNIVGGCYCDERINLYMYGQQYGLFYRK